MDHAGCFVCRHPVLDRPCSAFVLANGEEGMKSEESVRRVADPTQIAGVEKFLYWKE